MAGKSNLLIFCMSSSFLITSYVLSNSALATPLVVCQPQNDGLREAGGAGGGQNFSSTHQNDLDKPLEGIICWEKQGREKKADHSSISIDKHFLIAKPPDERQPEAVEQGIEQIPTSQAPVPRKSNPPIESPIPTNVSPGSTETNPTPQPSNGGATPTPSTPSDSTPQPSGHRSTPRQSRPSDSTPSPSDSNYTPRSSAPVNSTPLPSGHRSISPRQGGHKPTTEGSPFSRSKTPVYREINFVDIAFGVLAPGNFQSQGRYFHFYQFEGRENQLIQIRLTGSADQRRSNNLSLNPLMFLLDPNKKVLLTRGSAGTANGVKDAFIFVRLPMKGTYTIAVTSRNPGEKGRYSLALRNDRASYTIDESSKLSQKSKTLRKNSSPYNVSQFQGKKDQLVSIRVDSIFEEFSPYIVLLNSQGKIVASDNDKDGKYSALIDRARLPEDGTYYVVVISAIPRERGTYRLTIF